MNILSAKPKLPPRCRIIPGYEYYCVSDVGDVYGCKAGGHRVIFVEWRKIALFTTATINGSSYKRVTVALSRNNVCRHKIVARLVLQAFVGPCPEGMQCCHNDSNSLNNKLSNLRWDTVNNNVKDRIRDGKGGTKLTPSKVLEIRRLSSNNVSAAKIAKLFNISACHVSDIKNGKTWFYIPKSNHEATARGILIYELTNDPKQ